MLPEGYKHFAGAEVPYDSYRAFRQSRPPLGIPRRQWLERPVGIGTYGPVDLRTGLGSVSKAEKMGRATGDNQDSSVCLERQGVFGVFDGVGGAANGAKASQRAADAITELMTTKYPNSIEPSSIRAVTNWAANCFQVMKSALEGLEEGDTTGVIARVFVDEATQRQTLCVAHCGDSRAYLVDACGTATLLTRDHGKGKEIYTSVRGLPGSLRGEVDILMAPVDYGDRIVLVSDGVTGDRAPDIVTTRQIGEIVHGKSFVHCAAQALLNTTKKDDTTAIVVELVRPYLDDVRAQLGQVWRLGYNTPHDTRNITMD